MPGLVGQIGLETDVGRFGSFLRSRFDQAGCDEAPSDRGHRYLDAVVLGQVPLDRVWPGVEALVGEFDAQVHYLMVHDIANPCR